MKADINLHSWRAKQARAAIALRARWLRRTLILVAVSLVLFGGWLVWFGAPAGWFIASLAAWPLMPVVWYMWYLAELPPTKSPTTIDDVLDVQLLGSLKHNQSPKDLAELVMRLDGGLFFLTRFGVGPNFLSQLNSQDPAASAQVWESAETMRRELGLSTITAATLTATLIGKISNRDQMLANLQLTYDDIVAGVRWYHHLSDIIRIHKEGKISGGIGRDLSFGFTPLLERFAVNVSAQVSQGSLTRQLEGHQQLLGQLVEQLANGGRKNVVLVGPAGAGKTTLIYAFAERLLRQSASVPPELKYRQVMSFDPATLIANAGGRGELERLVNQLLSEAYRAKNIILFFDNAELFFGESTGAVDLRNVLMPVLEAGSIRIILSMDEQQWLALARATPALTQQLNRLSVPPLDQNDTMLVCEDQLILYEYQRKVTYMYQAMKTAYRLGSRYVADLAMPGQALRVLENAAQYADKAYVTSSSIEQAIEQAFGVKVANARGTDERQTLLNLEQLLHERMINQTRAVGVVSNALRRARSGVRNQNRPIGSFLFLGPTGVGKTELAKALASVYFGGEDHIVRLDLNEFGQAKDVSRLIADGATDPRSLTAQIAKQPFSVVLLDEIEKAHPNVLNTLLQLLDEGILRDINNRDISFRDAVVIATSNAGADKIRQYITAGQRLEDFEDEFTNGLIDSGVFKPEFLNRFDEIVLFRPLTEDELMKVVDLMLASVNKTLALQQIAVDVAPDAKHKLVQVGNDPRLGARPLRRVVQRTVENIVAKRLLGGQTTPGETLHITLADVDEALSNGR